MAFFTKPENPQDDIGVITRGFVQFTQKLADQDFLLSRILRLKLESTASEVHDEIYALYRHTATTFLKAAETGYLSLVPTHRDKTYRQLNFFNCIDDQHELGEQAAYEFWKIIEQGYIALDYKNKIDAIFATLLQDDAPILARYPAHLQPYLTTFQAVLIKETQLGMQEGSYSPHNCNVMAARHAYEIAQALEKLNTLNLSSLEQQQHLESLRALVDAAPNREHGLMGTLLVAGLVSFVMGALLTTTPIPLICSDILIGIGVFLMLEAGITLYNNPDSRALNPVKKEGRKFTSFFAAAPETLEPSEVLAASPQLG